MNISRQLKGPDERSIGALRPVVIFLLNLFFFFLFPFDCQRMIRKIDLNIVFINSRKLSLNYDVVFLFVKIHRRAGWLHPLGSKPSFWPPRPHPPSKKFFHHPIHVSLPPRKVINDLFGATALGSFSCSFSTLVHTCFWIPFAIRLRN